MLHTVNIGLIQSYAQFLLHSCGEVGVVTNDKQTR